MRLALLAVAAVAAIFGSLPASAAGVDKLYILYCGEAVGVRPVALVARRQCRRALASFR